ncbi:MAG: nucleotide sugar dehydrogenase [Crocinitomicaceae bacterium]|nr:nucleotide sugar dehydrogenase [Crocinitomicaceae bacterium]
MEKIGIIGTGRLGICLALNLERVGYEVIAIDVDEERVNQINAKCLHVEEPLVEDYLKNASKLSASTSINALEGVDFIFVCVPTPSLPNGKYDHTYIQQCVDALLQLDKPSKEVDLVINATTMPGFCDELHAQVSVHNYKVSYNPEFIAQGSIIRDQQYPDQVLIGEADSRAGDRIEEVYSKLCPENPVVQRMSRTGAEITKLSINCFLTTKIAFANAIGDLSKKMGADYEKVLASIGSDSRIGNSYLSYGFGFGGPCLPRDNRALGIAGEELGLDVHISDATDKSNLSHLDFQFKEYLQKDEPIIFDQLTYKPGTDIIVESQHLALAVKLAEAGKRVEVLESIAVIEQVKNLYGDLFTYKVNQDE